jgi:tRNA (guanine37-N1)-methyltransferase
MKITIITLFPKMISGFFEESIVKRAKEKGLIEVEIVNLRDFAIDDYGTVDDRPYGGGAGMILRADVINKALNKIKDQRSKIKTTKQNLKIVLTSAKGKIFNQAKATEYSKLDHLIIVAGHYEGVDERVLDGVDEEISLGDFVLTGGEIVAATITDSVSRLIPGVLKKEDATKIESYFDIPIEKIIEVVGEGDMLKKLKKQGKKTIKLLEYPQYTRPEDYQGKKVPSVLLSGNPKEITKWQIKKAYEETIKKRKDLLDI